MHITETQTENVVKSSVMWKAMGSPCEIAIWSSNSGSPSDRANLLNLMTERVSMLETAWTRFSEDSEISRLNSTAGSGRSIQVSNDTWNLISRMMDAYTATQGLYDPTVGKAMKSHGYDRTYPSLRDRGPADLTDLSVPGASRITLDRDSRSVMLDAGVSLDAGGIGKGLTGDILLADLTEAGLLTAGVLINMGGDIVLSGAPGTDQNWVIAVRDENQTTRDIGQLEIPPTRFGQKVAIATSTTLTKRWTADGQPRHHVIDPSTAFPSTTGLVQATAVAHEGWLAEAAATAALLLNDAAPTWMQEHGITGITGTPTHFTPHNNNTYATARVTQ